MRYNSTKLDKSIKIMLYNITLFVKFHLTITLVIFIIKSNFKECGQWQRKSLENH